MKSFINDWKVLLPLAILLGLLPFFPEPHLWAKLRWVAGGHAFGRQDAHGMQPMDWLDLLWHGFPIILLARLGILHLMRKQPAA